MDINWNKKFDLVVAAMCPAINNKSALRFDKKDTDNFEARTIGS